MEFKIPYNIRTNKVLRIEISSACNYNCTFCCWDKYHSKNGSIKILNPTFYRLLIEAMIQSNCYNVQLTGGEPLTVNRNTLCEIVHVLAHIDKLKTFYLTTNASLLDDDYCKKLFNAGLKILRVSIGAENNMKYQKYAQPKNLKINLDFILERLKAAIKMGFDISVHVPVSTDGIQTYDQLMELVHKLEKIGVTEISFFKLHKTNNNKHIFDKLYNEGIISSIVQSFLKSSLWKMTERDNYLYFTNGKIYCFIPLKFERKNTFCKQKNICGDYCQGAYSAYFIAKQNNIYIRACHREFKDRRNEFIIDKTVFINKKIDELTDIFNNVWRWTAVGQSV